MALFKKGGFGMSKEIVNKEVGLPLSFEDVNCLYDRKVNLFLLNG